MAVTKIHAIQSTVHKAVAYICNPEKTDENILVSSFACSPETAAYDFRFSLSKTDGSDPNKAYHLIQSFMPGEVSYKEAHQIGVELADRLLEGKYSYVVSTHIDKDHVHNHIIFCAADNIDYKKFHSCRRSYYRIRKLNDQICKEHELSVISPNGEHGRTYKEWLENQRGGSWKTALKKHIDEAIKNAGTYEECIALIRAKGYEVKGETFGDNSLKYISFRPLDRERFVRGSEKSLGADYTKERIRERIEEKSLAKENNHGTPDRHVAFPKRKRTVVQNHSSRSLIDTTAEKFAESPGLRHWADIQNLKIAAASYSDAGSISELEKERKAKSALAKTARESLVETEHQIKDLAQVIKYAEQYKENHIYHVRYLKSKDKDAYFRRRETELILHDGAENMLKRFGINPRSLDIEKLRREYNALCSKKDALQQTYKAAEKDSAELTRKLDNLNKYLQRNPDHDAPGQIPQKDKSSNSL